MEQTDDEHRINETSKPDGADFGKTTVPRSVTIKKSTLQTAGVVFAGILIAGAMTYYVPQTRIARSVSSHSNAVLEAVGIEVNVIDQGGNLETDVSDVFGRVRDLYMRNTNQMREGRYNQLMFTVYDEFASVETLFLANGRSEERREYLRKRLDSAAFKEVFTVYTETAPKADVIQTATGLQSALDSYLATSLDDRTRAAYYLERSLWPVTRKLIDDEGKELVVKKVYETMSPEAIGRTAVSYITTSQAQSQTAQLLLDSMTPEERGVFMQKYIGMLPQGEVDTLALALVPAMSPNGYAQVDNAITDRKIDQGFEKGKELLDRVKEYVKH